MTDLEGHSEISVALAGDTMLGRGVAERLSVSHHAPLFSDEVVAFARRADLFVLNLECCISERGEPWPDPSKPFFFRAPPEAVEELARLGVGCVTLGNNHALDYGPVALGDTFDHLAGAGIAWVGAGKDLAEARKPAVLEVRGRRLAVIGVSDHPDSFAATEGDPGIAHADLRRGVPSWLTEAIDAAVADAVLVTPHWGPNMVPEPLPYVREAARTLAAAGATLVAGHSAHVFHGVEGPVLYDLGDFVDDYAVDPELRNDLGLLFLVTLDAEGPRRLEALPLRLEYCFTRPATGEEAAWVTRRFREACGNFGTDVAQEDGRVVLAWS